MIKSLFLKKPTSLSTIGNWLLALPDKGESLEGPPKVWIDRRIDVCLQLLFHFCLFVCFFVSLFACLFLSLFLSFCCTFFIQLAIYLCLHCIVCSFSSDWVDLQSAVTTTRWWCWTKSLT
jgi:hypothetical protein